MGYLNDTITALDQLLEHYDAGQQRREFVRSGFYLGVKAMFEVFEQAARLNSDERQALYDGCEDDLRRFQREAANKMMAILEAGK
ncbi:hypothetical protein BDI4_100045 [Burkholderia diffusa]|uniref:hypothetical protein n=1 Tax=Burkholderia diffusa TaxID=488732 RepID=UPI001CAEA18F|nr:hypothetical protein [Burkholderia diffusa]CAG9241100.1 hypothetical protein BDI4_100045 [Burkholderia diffusa]